MQKKENNYAFIDSQNLHLGIQDLGWKIDYEKFRIYLREKYSVTRAYLFIGYIEENGKLYENLKKKGFICIFKPITKSHDSIIKGNVDVDLTLYTMIHLANFNKAIIVTGDGDFQSLIRYLIKRKKFEKILVPNSRKCSWLLKDLNSPKLNIIDLLQRKRSTLEHRSSYIK